MNQSLLCINYAEASTVREHQRKERILLPKQWYCTSPIHCSVCHTSKLLTLCHAQLTQRFTILSRARAASLRPDNKSTPPRATPSRRQSE